MTARDRAEAVVRTLADLPPCWDRPGDRVGVIAAAIEAAEADGRREMIDLFLKHMDGCAVIGPCKCGLKVQLQEANHEREIRALANPAQPGGGATGAAGEGGA